MLLRNEIKMHNVRLAGTAKEAGVIDPRGYATFQDHSYRGLYVGLGAKDIQRRKRLKKSQQILDLMGSKELAANLFRATQTEEKLGREKVRGKDQAGCTDFEVAAKVRRTMDELSGTIPEDLPPAETKKLDGKNVNRAGRCCKQRISPTKKMDADPAVGDYHSRAEDGGEVRPNLTDIR